jgi:hypothetical protein
VLLTVLSSSLTFKSRRTRPTIQGELIVRDGKPIDRTLQEERLHPKAGATETVRAADETCGKSAPWRRSWPNRSTAAATPPYAKSAFGDLERQAAASGPSYCCVDAVGDGGRLTWIPPTSCA